MAQKFTNSFVSTSIPGAYINSTVKSNPVGLGASGNVVIIGEADGGDVFSNIDLKNNSFTPDQLARVEQTYISGQIVDAFRALSAPSSDADISGSANRIYIVKTNSGSKASAIVDTDYGTLEDKNWGKDGNKYKYQITNTNSEVAPSLEGSTISAFGAALDGAEFQIRLNGGASATVTLSAVPADHATQGDLIIELNNLLPSGIVASAGTASNSIKLTMSADAAANRKGWGKSFELVDSTPGDLAALGLVAGLVVSSVEPSIEVAISRPDTNVSENIDVLADIALQIGYLGTTAVLTIDQTAKTLAVTVTGGSGANLSIDLSQYKTLSDLVSFINSNTGYSASVAAAAQQLAPSALDEVAAIGICSASSLKPGRIKKAAFNFQRALATSSVLDFEADAAAGLPTAMASAAFLSGGARGNTLAANIVDAIDKLASINVNIVIPLFSRDASADIADGLTASGSTYTIEAINAAVKSHCIQYSTPKLKRNRIAIVSYWNDNFVEAKQVAQGLAHYRVSVAFQKVSQVNSAGQVVSFLPWYKACVAAGMQAGGFYKSFTNKYANVISITDPSGFDSGSPGDVEDALEAGLLILTQDTAGNKFVSDQTTYGFDSNFVYNSVQAVYCADILALDLADSFQKAFVGKSLADVDAATAKSFLAQKMASYKTMKLIAASDDAPLGYKNDKISISGPVMDVSLEIKLATAVYFIPISLSISQVQSEA